MLCVESRAGLCKHLPLLLIRMMHDTSKYTNHVLDLALIYIINKNAENVSEGKHTLPA